MFIAGNSGVNPSHPDPTQTDRNQLTNQAREAVEYMCKSLISGLEAEKSQAMSQLDDATTKQIQIQVNSLGQGLSEGYSSALSNECNKVVSIAEKGTSSIMKTFVSNAKSQWNSMPASEQDEYFNNQNIYIANQLKASFLSGDLHAKSYEMNTTVNIGLDEVNWAYVLPPQDVQNSAEFFENADLKSVTSNCRFVQSVQEQQIEETFQGKAETLNSQLNELSSLAQNVCETTNDIFTLQQVSGDLVALCSKPDLSIDDVNQTISNLKSLSQ